MDYTGPTSGTATIAANTVDKEVLVPLVNDGFGEPNETFQVRLTSASVPADLSSIGTETILDGSRRPADCSLSKNAPDQMGMTCTNRRSVGEGAGPWMTTSTVLRNRGSDPPGCCCY